MPVVLVHGLPETAAVWEPLQAVLPEPALALAVPGFGVEGRGDGSKDALAAWLADALRTLPQPVDVVAHDLGALLTLRVVTARLAPVRSWVVDVAELFHPDAAWPDRVRRIQRDGEAPPADPARLEAAGMPAPLAARIAAAHDARMDEAVVAFYRSAVPNVAADWWLADPGAEGRGLVLQLPDPPLERARTRAVAAHLGAGLADLGDLRHCWMAEDPQVTARVLTRFWEEARCGRWS